MNKEKKGKSRAKSTFILIEDVSKIESFVPLYPIFGVFTTLKKAMKQVAKYGQTMYVYEHRLDDPTFEPIYHLRHDKEKISGT